MILRRLAADPETLGELEHRWALEHRAILQQRDGQAVGVDAGDPQQLARLAVTLDVQPARGHAVARQEVAQLVRILGEAMPDDAHAAGLERCTGLPCGQKIFHNREQLLLRGVPRLEQVVVQRDVVDRRDRSLRVGIGGEQHALGVRNDLARLHEVRRARHPRHTLVCDQHRHLVAARAQLAQQVQRLSPGRGSQYPEALAEAAPQIARHGGEHRRLVIDRDDRRTALRRGWLSCWGGHPGKRYGCVSPRWIRREPPFSTRCRTQAVAKSDVRQNWSCERAAIPGARVALSGAERLVRT